MFRVTRTIFEMLNDRGFEIADSLLNRSFATFKEQNQDRIKFALLCLLCHLYPVLSLFLASYAHMTVLARHRRTEQYVLVFFPEEPKVRVSTARKFLISLFYFIYVNFFRFIKDAQQYNVKHILIVAREGFAPQSASVCIFFRDSCSFLY